MKRLQPLIVALGLLFAAAAFGNGVTLPDAERIVLENGTVLILNENHDVPLIGLRAVVRGGASADPADKHGLANLLANLLEKGSGDRSAAEFAETVAAVGGQLNTAANIESITISASFMADDGALLVELVSDLLRRPALGSAEFKKLRERSINLIKAAKGSDPGDLMPDYANAFLFDEHPYGNPIGGSESSLAKIRHADLMTYYADMVGADRLIISVSGDFETAEMRELLTIAFSDWRPAAGSLPVIEAPEMADGGRVYLVDKPGATQTYFYIGNVGVARGYPQRAELDLANTVFGGRFTSMLVTELRTKSGLSYSARSILTRNAQPGAVFISSFTETSTTVAALDVALSTLARLRDSGLDAAMIESARNYVMGQFPPRLETAGQLAGIFATLALNGLDASYINDYGDNLAAATPESVAAVIEQVYPSSDDLVFVLIGDADLIREQLTAYGDITEISLSEPRFHP